MKGSSPLTRGKHLAIADEALRAGLIPAHAGKTLRATAGTAKCAAHPRSRGENRARRGADCFGEGSSPLTRGKPVHAATAHMTTGLIPAHAGKTRTPSRRSRAPRAHPRSRGENSVRAGGSGLSKGSSPLTRGKLGRALTSNAGHGLIPAHAGKTGVPAWTPGARPAHPRSRGENCAGLGAQGLAWGSSPLTRGKPVFSTPR